MSVKEKYSAGAQFNERPDDSAGNGLTRDELAFLAGTTPEIIEQLVELDLIVPREHAKACLFGIEAVPAVRRILRLRRHLQISFDSMALVYDLLARIEELEQRLNKPGKE